MTKTTIDNGEVADISELSDQPVPRAGFTLVVMVGIGSANRGVSRMVKRVCIRINVPMKDGFLQQRAEVTLSSVGGRYRLLILSFMVARTVNREMNGW